MITLFRHIKNVHYEHLIPKKYYLPTFIYPTILSYLLICDNLLVIHFDIFCSMIENVFLRKYKTNYISACILIKKYLV